MRYAPYILPENDQDRQERSKVEHHIQEQLRFCEPEQMLRYDQMTGTAHREELGQPLYQTKQYDLIELDQFSGSFAS